ncbi:MAG: hypothetical protein PWQ79_1540 [Thermococcaceae archaeon]|nr:hypothetical protein [Thermococcaceae archaeon]MDK2914625.1 hypothetical protein [Thermococcaceae archaeon]
MGFLSFGSKKDKVKKLIEEERFEEIVEMASKDKKAFNAVFELLDESAPGILGDALLLITMVADRSPDAIEPHVETLFPKAVQLAKHRNPYVKENAMILAYELVGKFKGKIIPLRNRFAGELIEQLKTGDNNTKGFMMMLIGELKIDEARESIEELLNVEDKVILPFEGKKWISLGEIARETLEKL